MHEHGLEHKQRRPSEERGNKKRLDAIPDNNP